MSVEQEVPDAPALGDESVMSPEQARLVLHELRRREQLRDPPYIRNCHDHQKQFLYDKNRFKAAYAGRRGGKTAMVTRGLVWRANYYNEGINAYVGVTREAAKRLMWRPLQNLCRKHGIQAQFNKVELIVYFPNGSEIWILGADKEEDLEKMRGPSYVTFVIDEAASYRPILETMVDDVVEPALGDRRGHLWVTGTPGRHCAGFWYDVCHRADGKEHFSVYHWNVRDNPFFDDPEGWLEETKRKKKFTEDHPTFKREYLGQWVTDKSSLVYKYDPAKNDIDRLPEPHPGDQPFQWTRILCIDFGVTHPTAFVVIAYKPHDPNVYVERAWARTDLSPSDVAERIKMLQEEYRPPGGEPWDAFEAIVGDTGGMGKAFAKELEQRHHIWIEPAEKQSKLAFIDHMNGDLAVGRLKVVRDACRPLIREWQQLAWSIKFDRLQDKYDDRLQDDHNADAALYGWRRARAYEAVPRETKPAVGTKAWQRAVQRTLLLQDLEDARAEREDWDKVIL